jgi:hypothetical protein
VRCEHPVRGVWGGPPDGNYQPTIAASKLAFAPRGKLEVASVVKRDLWEIGLRKAAPSPAAPPSGGRFATPPIKKQLEGLGFGALLGLIAIGGGWWLNRRKRAG